MSSWNDRWAVDGPLDVRVRFGAGHLEVTAVDDGTASATVEALDPDDRRSVELAATARVALSGGRLTVDVPARSSFRGGGQVKVVVAVPPMSSLDSSSGDCTLTTDGHLADVRVRTGNAEIRTPSVAGAVDVKAGNATLVVGAARAVSFTCGHGRLEAGSVGDVVLKTGNGEAALGSTYGSVVVKGGRVALDLREATAGDVSFDSGMGNARIGVPTGTTVQLDLSSGIGDVRCELPVESAAPAGGAGLRLRLRTGAGDLLVARA